MLCDLTGCSTTIIRSRNAIKEWFNHEKDFFGFFGVLSDVGFFN